MKQAEALAHVFHSGGSLYIHSGWRGHKFLVCHKDQTTIGMPMLERLLIRDDLEAVSNPFNSLDVYAVLTDQGRRRLTVPEEAATQTSCAWPLEVKANVRG